MQKITAELLGSGRILLDGKQVNLPFKQAEALVYYLLVEKETFRPKLADIIWGDSADEHKVQSNMRNAIYVIRREFGRDFLVGASKNVIQINPEIRIDLDIDRFNDKNLTDFSFYAGDFLENFYLKDNEYYNEWLLNNRQHYRGLLQERLKESIVAAFQDERYKDCELECQKLMALDEFDEFGYVYLIEIYRARGEYSSAVALYDRLEKLLSEELFQSPSEEITALVQNIRQVSFPFVQLNLSALYPRHIQNIIYKREQVFARYRYLSEIIGDLLFIVDMCSGECGKSDNSIHRRADVMGHTV